ncbi:MAG: hypothetical protein HRU20_23680, partial [Pseudomonadales bacterium]|nr:hypothetical protein [Pseudomonadales bacterium]
MLMPLIKKIFGTRNDREIKRMLKVVKTITAYEEEYTALSDAQIQAKTDEFKKRIADGETLDDLLPEAFATVREAGKRVLNMRHFDVQMV